MNAKTASQALMLENRLRKRYRHLSKWARRTGAGAFRLYDRDIPEIPLVLDFYREAEEPETCGQNSPRRRPDGEFVAGSLYRRPYDKDPAEEELWLTAMGEAIGGALEIPASALFIRERRRRQGGVQHGPSRGGVPRPRDGGRIRVREGGLQFWVNLSDYLDTGLFLDRRLLRALLRDTAGGKRVLNLFAHTCSFSVYAAAGGAASVDSVDLSNTYLDWGRRNFELNDLAEKPEFRFLRADVRPFLAGAALARRYWDLIILDPPTFSNSTMMEGTLDIQRDHGPLLEQCLGLLNPGGTLIFSVNMKGFKLNREIPRDYCPLDLTEKLRDEDFKGRRIPACYLFKPG
ncbi:MAG: class I SAM-dependent methyltransferase [Treponema sp.]|jgi:23S rRNA G2069 N7-methylase RlmK/C1962 C5-methylase RlmI|nr:class I SAM-dependent methyltransferase [Treponema sp.]